MRPMQQQPLPAPRRAQVLGVGNDGSLIVRYGDSFQGGAPFPAPRMGSTQSGFQTVPVKDANMLVLAEGYGHGLPVGGISVGDALPFLEGKHPHLKPGESCIFGPDGSILSYLRASGPIVLYQNHDGSVALTIDPVTGVVALTHPAGGGFKDNGTTIAAP